MTPPPPSPPRQPRHHRETWGLVLVVCACGWLYFWNANPAPAAWFNRAAGDFYGYQTAGFLSGQLATSNPPHPTLLALPNPYDPVANAPYRVHDMSLWRGKYYLYFGATPAVLFFAPVRILFGSYPTESFAVVSFLTVGLAAGAMLLASLRRTYFPTAPAWVTIIGTLVLGLANPVVQLTSGAQVYQVPIACAYALQLLALAAALRALRSPRHALVWLLAAGTAVGLALGARPNTLAATPWLVVPLIAVWHRTLGRGRPWFKTVTLTTFAAYGPVALAGLGLLLINWLRFGSASEFGATYQLAGSNQLALAMFSPSRIWDHLPDYLFNQGTWQPYFPFLILPEGRPWGVALYLPWLWLGLAALWPNRGRRALTSLLLLPPVANLLLITCYFATVERYLCDFTPGLLLLGAVGALTLTARPRQWLQPLTVTAGAVTLAAGLLIFAQRATAQEKIRPLGRTLNQVARLWDHAHGRQHGAIRLEIELPATPPVGWSEPLVETGRQADLRDWLQLTYQPDGTVSFEFFHAGFGLVRGRRLPVPADRRLSVELRCGALLPPLTHPLFASWTEDDYRRERDQLWIIVNGVELLRTTLACYEAGPGDILLGQHRDALPLPGQRFSGRILHTERRPFAPAAEPRSPTLPAWGTPLALTLTFPSGRAQGAEPLLATGSGRQSDLLYFEHVAPHQIRFAFDHYGYGGLTSAPITVDPQRTHELVIWSGALADATTPDHWRRRLVVRLNGQTVIDGEQQFYASARSSAALGLNPNRATTAGRQFTGRLLAVRPLLLDGS